MRIHSARASALLLAVIQLTAAVTPPTLHRPRDYSTREYYAVQLADGSSPEEYANLLQLEYEGPLGELAGHHIFSGPLGDHDVVEHYRRRRKRDLGDAADAILFSAKQKPKQLHKRIPPPHLPNQGRRGFLPEGNYPEGEERQKEIAKKLGIEDPLFKKQWHLFNPIFKGHDLNVTGLWEEGITGFNATVAIVDDGLDMDSDDLRDNYFEEGSWDFNDYGPRPNPKIELEDTHGTRCAGEIAAVKNHVCGVGVAWNAKVAGLRILSKQISDIDEAVALNYAYDKNQIYSCSWGPPDDGKSMEAPSDLIRKAIMNGVQNGRGGLGSVFVFASGNGAQQDDNCNFDGYTNSIYSITVGAIDRKGLHPYYSELCSAQMVVTYSSGSGDSIHTTDVGKPGQNACYDSHGGTSAAAPLAAGVFALVLQERPDLTWRDMQYLALDTAIPINEDDDDWVETAIGKKFNHKYGYGKLDAWAIVHAAKTFKSVKPQAWFHSPVLSVNHKIPEGGMGLKSGIMITDEDLKEANLERVEHVTIKMNLRHGLRGDVSVDLISPHGITSHIATARRHDKSPEGYKDWEFMTVKHWGEDGRGLWTVVVKDHNVNSKTGVLIDWNINLWGESIDPKKAINHLFPGDQSALPAPPKHTKPVPATTVPVSAPPPKPDPTEKPDDHVDRPAKITATSSTADSTGNPSPPPNTTQKPESDKTDNTSFLPSILPTFGVSATTQIWIYGSLVAIIAFIAGLGTWLYRKRKRVPVADGMDYEFQALNTDDADADVGGGTVAGIGRGKGKKGKRAAGANGEEDDNARKARDLYDAFGGSDDEEGSLFSVDGEKERYRDHDEESEDGAGSGSGSSEGRERR